MGSGEGVSSGTLRMLVWSEASAMGSGEGVSLGYVADGGVVGDLGDGLGGGRLVGDVADGGALGDLGDGLGGGRLVGDGADGGALGDIGHRLVGLGLLDDGSLRLEQRRVAACDLDGEVGDPHLHGCGGGHERDGGDPLAVDEGAVERAQILDLEPSRNWTYDRVPARHLPVLDHQICALATDDQLAVAIEALSL